MASRLSLYGDIALLCGERAPASLTETTELRRLLDQVWNNGGVDYCLSQGYWPHALRTQQIDYDPAVTPQFGYAYAFTQPDDWISTAGISEDEYLQTPLINYAFEGGYWWADVTPIYVRYVSNDAGYGNNIGEWPETFKEFVAAYFASKVVLKVTGDPEKTSLVISMWKKMEHDAKSQAVMSRPPTFLPRGNWVRSRGSDTRRDRGNTGSLTG